MVSRSITLILLICCCAANAYEYNVEHAGALKNFRMKGDISAKFNLKQLENKPGIYALGAFENLKGEIQIFNSVPYNTFVEDRKIIFDTTFEKKAALLVYSQVKSWQELSIPKNISSQSELETFIQTMAVKNGLNIKKPFPFLISGNAKLVSWHVINWDENDKEHNHQKHIESGLNGRLVDTKIDILGFYSNQHKGIFTHHSTNMHMHFKTKDKTVAGHIDKLEPGLNMRLKLPTVKK